MGLLNRIQQNAQCRVRDCQANRAEGAEFCRDNGHLGDFWLRRLVEQPDGTFVPKAQLRWRPTAKDMTGAPA